jgi:hypothetical protein
LAKKLTEKMHKRTDIGGKKPKIDTSMQQQHPHKRYKTK